MDNLSTSQCSQTTLVYTVALNGYADRYETYIESQRKYASRNGYEYLAVTEPSWKYGASEAAWLKIAVMNDALNAGFDQVAYIDSDAQVLSAAPALCKIYKSEPSMHVFMARGHSGRFNAGVIFARNDQISRFFFQQVWDVRGASLDRADDVGWGDNGHVIKVARQMNCVKEIPTSWNNTRWPPPAAEFIRHHTGPLRDAEVQQDVRFVVGSRPVERFKSTGVRLTTGSQDSAALIERTQMLAAEYRPRIPTPQPPPELRKCSKLGQTAVLRGIRKEIHDKFNEQ